MRQQLGAAPSRTTDDVTKTYVDTAVGTAAKTANNLSDLASASTARTNLGLGSAATMAGPSGTIVGTSDTQTLTSKTLTSPVISTIVNTGTLTLPTSTDTLVGRATTDTLTNKTLTSGTNTFPTFNQSTTGNAATATALATSRNIAGVSFNGTANIALPYDLSFVGFGATTPRATGTGDNPMGILLQRAVTLTSVTFRCATADGSGNTVVQLNRNGSAITAATTTIASANQVAGATTTFSQACSAGDIITAYVYTVGSSPGNGLVVDITGSF